MVRSNHKPEFDGSDSGMAARIQLLEFTRVPAVKDSTLRDKIVATELPGILNGALAGAARVVERDGITMPPAVVEATRVYIPGERCVRRVPADKD